MSEVAKSAKHKPLLARAHYNNVAERPDELSFRQGDVITVLEIDYNGQVDWWLCQLNGMVGMVPANYLDIYHQSGYDTYDVPRSNAVSPHSAHSTHTDDGIYDLPPTDGPSAEPPDYDMPPNDGPDYDRPQSHRSSTKSPYGSTRLSQVSQHSNGSIYDTPPSSDQKDYDTPKSNAAAPKRLSVDEDADRSVGGTQQSLLAVDIEAVNDEEADDMLSDYRRLVSTTYESLFQSVYGPEAYWGTDNKVRKMDTLQRTVTAAKYFDRALAALLGFGKGVANTLESCSDTNFKKKFGSAHQGLIEKRQSVLDKIEGLTMENETLTATVKSLLELARTVPSAATEFTVLVQANKALLFKSTPKSSLPVITKNEVKTRPLPELPLPPGTAENGDVVDDYACIPTDGDDAEDDLKADATQVVLSEELNADNKKKRNPTDELPPLPYATLPRPQKGKGSQKGTSNQPQVIPSQSARNVRDSFDYDIVDGQGGGGAKNPAPSPPIVHPSAKVRKGSLGSSSASSEENISNGATVEKIESPYGRPVQNRPSNAQPLRQEDRQLLERFSQQMELIIPNLRETVDTLVTCLRDNEPPKDFVNKSKLTVVAAYKLVYIADALCQKILHNDTKTAILASSNHLTEVIKGLVSDTKTAALQYPSVLALGKMSESLKKLFPTALEVISTVKSRSVMVSSC